MRTPFRRRTRSTLVSHAPHHRRTRGWPLVLGAVAAAACALAGPVRAEDAPPLRPGAGEVEIIIGDEITIPDLLKNVTSATKKSIIWNAEDKVVTTRKIQGAQKLRAPADKLFEMVRGLLTFQEIVLIPLGPKGYEVWVAIDARQLANQFILKNKPVYVDLSTGSDEVIEARLKEIENQDGL